MQPSSSRTTVKAGCFQNRCVLPTTASVHDDRAQHRKPVASRLGPRFYDWQLVQTADESWRECHLHARNLLGAREYARLLSASDDGSLEDSLPLVAERRSDYVDAKSVQKSLFDPGTATKATSRRAAKKGQTSHDRQQAQRVVATTSK